jgi:hypothetical protein
MSTPEYITSSEGEKLLGVSRQRFFYYVSQGKIRREAGPSPRKSLYNKEDIIRLKATIGEAELLPELLIDWVQPMDLPKTMALDLVVYQEDLIGDFKLYFSWLKRNPNITLAAFSADRSTVYGYLNLLPLKEQTIHHILKGERDETSISSEEIQIYQSGGEYTLLAESIVSHPDYPEVIGLILNRVASYWCEQWPQRKVTRIYAQTVSDEGLFLVQKLFFAPLFGFPDNAYMLDMQRKNPSRFVRSYQECIAAKDSK